MYGVSSSTIGFHMYTCGAVVYTINNLRSTSHIYHNLWVKQRLLLQAS